MASSDLTFEQIFKYFKENGNVIKNRELVHHFKSYLTDPESKDDARTKFRRYVNTLAQTRTENVNGEKVLVLKTRYVNAREPPRSPGIPDPTSPVSDSRIALGIPVSSTDSSLVNSPVHRQPPPYRPPPPPISSSNSSLDTISISSSMSQQDTPQAPPRRKGSAEKHKNEDGTPRKQTNSVEDNNDEKQTVSVKERTEKFNRLASVEDELSPRPPKSAEKSKFGKGSDEDDGASVTSLEPKKCMEWCVTASKGDLQELVKLAKDEPRLVNRKDPFTAYSVLHWGAKHGNVEIIKTFAGTYKVDVNGRTNGGYTPLHLAAQFGHKDVFKLLIEVYKADTKIRDYSGRLPEYYLLARELKGKKDNIRSEYGVNIRHGKPPTFKHSFRSKTKSLPANGKVASSNVRCPAKVISGSYQITK